MTRSYLEAAFPGATIFELLTAFGCDEDSNF